MKRTTLITATWTVVPGIIVLLIHAAVHVGLHNLPMTLFDNLFIGIVLILLPPVALFMMYNSRLSRWGALLLVLSMPGGLVYELLHHFLLPGMDNVANPGPEPLHLLFVMTSYLHIPLLAAGAIVGMWALLPAQQTQTQAES